MKQSDISYALTMVLHAMSPPNTKTVGPSGSSVKPVAEIRTGSLTFTGTRDTKTSAKINTSLYQVSFLGQTFIIFYKYKIFIFLHTIYTGFKYIFSNLINKPFHSFKNYGNML